MDKAKKSGNSEEIGKIIARNLDEALEFIFSNKFSQSLDLLKVVEKRLEKGVNKGLMIDKDLILVTLHSMALCYQSLGNLLECCTYLEACIFNIKKEIDKVNTQTVSPDKIRKIRYLSLLNTLLSECLFKRSLFKQSAEAAKSSTKYSLLAIRLCLSACTELKFKHSKNSQKYQELYHNSSNVLQALYTVLNGKKLKKDSTIFAIRSSIGVQKVSDWVLTLTFDKILEIKPISVSELKSVHTLSTELSKDFLFDKICLSITSLFMLSQSLSKLPEEQSKAKIFIQRAIKLASLFFPKTCPIFQTLSDTLKSRFISIQTIKKIKSPPRSTSVRYSPKMQEALEKVKISFKIAKVTKTHSARSSDTDTGITKSSQTHSGSTIHNLKSLPKFEKTEPEPALSEESEKGDVKNIGICSKELYGNYSEEEVDKYEYMPLRRNI